MLLFTQRNVYRGVNTVKWYIGGHEIICETYTEGGSVFVTPVSHALYTAEGGVR